MKKESLSNGGPNASLVAVCRPALNGEAGTEYPSRGVWAYGCLRRSNLWHLHLDRSCAITKIVARVDRRVRRSRSSAQLSLQMTQVHITLPAS